MIFALESSCDETALAVFDPARGLLGEWVHSQMALHEGYGGVVPNLAAREHLRRLPELLERTRGVREKSRITRVAVTHGPGLAACLAIGVAAAKSLALAWRVPVSGINHLRGHAWSPFLALHAADPGGFAAQMQSMLPHLGLIVSGGHTLLFTIDGDRRIAVLSSTRDDAAGEALDKGAKLLGLGYPGGPLVEKLAETGRPDAFEFPRGMDRRGELDFSFSGLKTSLRYLVEKMPAADVQARRADLCASYQQAVIGALTFKTRAALARGGFRSLGLSGGVARNECLRTALAAEAQRERLPFFPAHPSHTGDNAGMIAFASWMEEGKNAGDSGMDLRIEPDLAL